MLFAKKSVEKIHMSSRIIGAAKARYFHALVVSQNITKSIKDRNGTSRKPKRLRKLWPNSSGTSLDSCQRMKAGNRVTNTHI